MIKKTLVATAALAVTMSAAAAQEAADTFPGEFSANVALTSDYAFRGISQTLEAPAIQGGIDWSMETDVGISPYIGTWGSNVDFGVDETLELDGYGGVTGTFAGIGWDLGVIYYAYPGAGPDYDFVEGKLGLSYAPTEMIELSGAYHYSPDYFAESGTAHYLSGGISVAPGLPYGIAFAGRVGHQWIEENATFGTPDYTDWSLGVSAEIEGLGVSLSYVDTDLDDSECFGGTDLCDARFIAAVSASF